MLLTFASADDVYADYVSVLLWGVIVVVGTIIILGAANKGSPSEVRTSTAIKIGCFAYLLLAVASYRETCGSFIGADIGADAATLHFAGALYPSVTLKREQIREVLFGFPGRGKPHTCYLKFVTTSGETYRSAPTQGTACKVQQTQVNALMSLEQLSQH
jgi:hypothetical protein